MQETHFSENRITRSYKVLYILSVVALVLVLCFNVVLFSLFAERVPEIRMQILIAAALILGAGIIVLVAQSLMVLSRLIPFARTEQDKVVSMQSQIDQFSIHDPLTHLFNRRKFEAVTFRELENVRRYAFPLTGIIFDVDGLKALNEDIGLQAGDKALASLARFVRKQLRQTDYTFRWRGGKFIILAPHTDVEQASMLADKLCQRIGHKLFGGTIRMSLSLGVVQACGDDSTESFMLKMQSVLVRAKNQGGNCVVTA